MPRCRPLALAVLAVLAHVRAFSSDEITWTMLNVSPHKEQADCHVLRMPDSSLVLIDAADAGDAPGVAVALLRQHNIRHLDLIVISHFHRDHYGRLLDILDAGVTVDRVLCTVPSKESADLERPWGCNLNHVGKVLDSLHARGIPCITPVPGMRLLEQTTPGGAKAGIEVLSANDGKDTPIGLTDVNGTSIVLRVFLGRTRALFTGDINPPMGAYLAKSDIDLRADVLKASHHGTEGTVPDEFYDRVGASALMVPSPKALWESARSKRTRGYFRERGIPAYVSGINGTVTVRLRPDGYTVEKER